LLSRDETFNGRVSDRCVNNTRRMKKTVLLR
jgi:hypothetical protein